MGSDVRLADPAELHPPKNVTDVANDIAARTGARITITDDPSGSHRLRENVDVADHPGPRLSDRHHAGLTGEAGAPGVHA